MIKIYFIFIEYSCIIFIFIFDIIIIYNYYHKNYNLILKALA